MQVESKLTIVLVFAVLFLSIGWMAPMLFYSYAPQGHFVDVHEFDAGNVAVGDTSHTVCFDRTFHQASSGTVFVELYLITDDGYRIEVLSENRQDYFQQGRSIISEEVELPADLREGSYRYERVYKMEVNNGQITRTFSFQSETFRVVDGATASHRC